MENRAFRKFEWSVWKLLDCRILHQIPKGFWEPWAAPKPPAVSNEPPSENFCLRALYIHAHMFISCQLFLDILHEQSGTCNCTSQWVHSVQVLVPFIGFQIFTRCKCEKSYSDNLTILRNELPVSRNEYFAGGIWIEILLQY